MGPPRAPRVDRREGGDPAPFPGACGAHNVVTSSPDTPEREPELQTRRTKGSTEMTTLIDFIMDLFRSPAAAAAYVADPEGALRDAGLPNVSAAQLASVAATAAPAGLALGNGDPVYGLQRAVADYHSIASPFSPQTAFTSQPTFAPQTNTDLLSGNSTDLASHNAVPIMSPNQDAGANAQQGAFNLGLGDITLGNKETTTNTATDGAVVNT